MNLKENNGGFKLTTINCTLNCVYQENGKCALQNVQAITSSSSNECAYFILKEQRDDKKMSP